MHLLSVVLHAIIAPLSHLSDEATTRALAVGGLQMLGIAINPKTGQIRSCDWLHVRAEAVGRPDSLTSSDSAGPDLD